MPVFDLIKKFMGDLTKADEPTSVIHSNLELAQAALMYHVIAVDGVVRKEEKERMAEVLGKQFDLSEEETRDLALNARDAEHEAVDLYKFTSILNQSLNEEQRIDMVEYLWEMVFADGVLHELEDNVVWRIAELLHVSSQDRMALKQRVWKRRGASASGVE